MVRIPPPEVIQSWPAPNYIDPVTRGNGIYYTLIILSAILVAGVSARLYSRVIVKQWFGWDDAMIIPATLCALAMNSVIILAFMRFDWDRHEWDILPAHIEPASICVFVVKLLYVLAMTFCRLSLVCFYYRLVRDSSLKWFYTVLHISLAANAIIGVAALLMGTFGCSPVQSYWVWPKMANSFCVDEGAEVLSFGVVFTVADLLTTITPIPLVMRLQMSAKHRIGVCILVSLGLIVTIVGAVRTYYVWKSLIGTWDETWWGYELWISTAVELDVALLCACAPAFKVLVSEHISKAAKRLASRSSPYHSSAEKSSRSSDSSSQKTWTFSVNPFRSRKGSIDAWDEEMGYEEYDDSTSQDDQNAASGAPSIYSKLTAMAGLQKPQRTARPYPRLEITRRQSVDQHSAFAVGGVLSTDESRFSPRNPDDQSAWRSKAFVSVGALPR